MAKKSAPKPIKKTASRTDPVDTALELAAQKGWAEIGFEDIAAASGHDLADLRERFADKTDIIAAFGRRLDRKALESAASGADMSHRDRLFDLLMERFDGLNEQRGGIVSFVNTIRCDPKQIMIGLPHLARSMARMLDAAGIEADGVIGAVKVAGLTMLYLKTLRIWAEDDSADLGKTMAALDRNLAKAEQLIQMRPFGGAAV
jgi:AcrR family transcriptional regulator